MILAKKYRRVMSRDPKDWCKIWRKANLLFQKWHESGEYFTRALESLQKLHFHLFQLCQLFNVLILMCSLMKYLNRNWLVVSELTWQIWRILTQSLESLKKFPFNVPLLRKVYYIWTKNVQRSYISWHWKGIQNLERNRLAISKLA